MLRPARRGDAEQVLRWRNHPVVRAHSLQTHEIALDEHLAWWDRVQKDPQRHIYIYERDGESSGVVNFDVAPDGSAMWGFYLDLAGLGDGPDLLRAWGQVFEDGIEMAFGELGVASLEGEVLVGNRAVRALHLRFGFEESAPFEREVDGERRHVVYMLLTAETRRTRKGR